MKVAANPEIDSKINKADMANAKEVLKLSREVGNSDLWKIYGRESEAGKMLFKLFGKGPSSIKIDYPKPKTEKKPLPWEQTKKSDLVPASKTIIDYPEVKSNAKPLPKVHAVDLIPKRKNENEIRREIEDFYSKPVVPLNKGVNRKQLVEDLQAKFKKQRGALPKGAELPLYQPDPKEVLEEITEEELRQRALQKIPKKLMTYTYEKPKKEEDDKKGLSKSEQQQELENLYEDVVAEIEERQQYLEEINHLDEPKIKERVKKEIVDRVAELQKIIQMLRKDE
jgi:hypothetical protein